MKKNVLLFALMLIYFVSSAQINISTGVDASGNSLAPGANDPFWKLAAGSPVTPNAIIEDQTMSGTWLPTPVSGTNALWIGGKQNPGSQIPGDYYFQRIITVPSNSGLMTIKISLAYDDDLKGLELIDPSGNVVDLFSKVVRSTSPNGYYLSKPIKYETKCPAEGRWRLVCKVNFYDTIAAFLLSGSVNFSGECQKPDATYEDTKCCIGDNKLNLSTGFENSTNSLFGTNAKDDDWKIVSGPSGATPAYQFSYAYYAPASSKAQWISPKGGGSAAGHYVYERQIVVPTGYKAVVTFSRIGADNDVVMSVTNGGTSSFVYTSNQGGYAFMAGRAILKKCLTIDLLPGTNILSCDVDNQSSITGLLVEGCYELIKTEPVCKCPQGWLSNTTNKDGDITTDGKCKKMICGPIDIKPLPKNGTQVEGNLGFFWGNELWWYGTKENGGAPICK